MRLIPMSTEEEKEKWNAAARTVGRCSASIYEFSRSAVYKVTVRGSKVEMRVKWNR